MGGLKRLRIWKGELRIGTRRLRALFGPCATLLSATVLFEALRITPRLGWWALWVVAACCALVVVVSLTAWLWCGVRAAQRDWPEAAGWALAQVAAPLIWWNVLAPPLPG